VTANPNSVRSSGEAVVRRPSRLRFTSRAVRVEVESADGSVDLQVIPLSSLSMIGHGRVDGERVSWAQVALAAAVLVPATPILAFVAFVMALGDDHSFGVTTLIMVGLPYLAFVALLGYKVSVNREDGLLLMNDAGYSAIFVSTDREAVNEVVEFVVAILEDPEGYAGACVEVDIDRDAIACSLVFHDQVVGEPPPPSAPAPAPWPSPGDEPGRGANSVER
jgi:hypothetical protein